MGRHKRVGGNLDAPLKEDAEDTASENEGTNSLLQTETLINIEKSRKQFRLQSSRTDDSLSPIYQHPSTVDTRQQTNTAHITGFLAIMLLPSFMSLVYNATSVFKVTFPWQLFVG